MESKLFARFDPESQGNEQFAKDLEQVLGLPQAQLDAILREAPALARAQTQADMREVVVRLERDGISPLTVQHATSLINFFARALLDEDTSADSPSQWAADLQDPDIGILAPDKASAFLEFVGRIKDDLLPELDSIRKQKTYGTGVLPSLKGGGTTVELRGIFREPYRWGSALSKYEPEVIGVVPVISVHIRLDAGTPNEIWFQATPEELDYLISEFQAAKTASAALQAHLREIEPAGMNDDTLLS